MAMGEGWLGVPLLLIQVRIKICVSPVERYRGGCNGLVSFASCLK